jgi:hypothetical protein
MPYYNLIVLRQLWHNYISLKCRQVSLIPSSCLYGAREGARAADGRAIVRAPESPPRPAVGHVGSAGSPLLPWIDYRDVRCRPGVTGMHVGEQYAEAHVLFLIMHRDAGHTDGGER